MSQDPRYIEHTCHSCRMRYRVHAPEPKEYNTVPIDRRQMRMIENAAAYFDSVATELFTAAEFVRWMRPDVPGTPEYEATRGNLIAGRPGRKAA